MIITLTAILPAISQASADKLKCEKEVTKEIEGKTMYNVVEKVHSKDGKTYVVVFRTASGDAEEASVAIVTANTETCKITKVQYVKGEH